MDLTHALTVSAACFTISLVQGSYCEEYAHCSDQTSLGPSNPKVQARPVRPAFRS